MCVHIHTNIYTHVCIKIHITYLHIWIYMKIQHILIYTHWVCHLYVANNSQIYFYSYKRLPNFQRCILNTYRPFWTGCLLEIFNFTCPKWSSFSFSPLQKRIILLFHHSPSHPGLQCNYHLWPLTLSHYPVTNPLSSTAISTFTSCRVTLVK